MNDPHERFREWLLSGAPGEPARDAALHASACDRCLRDVGALDALIAVDVAAGEVPILPAGAQRPMHTPGVRALRALGGVTAVGLLVLAAMIGSGALREDTAGPGIATNPTDSPDGEGILAGGPSLAAATAGPGSPRPTTSADEAASEEPDASEVASEATPTLPPFVAPPPPAITPGPTSAATPRPTTAATASPTAVPTGAPTAAPTPTVAATPTPVPTPTPTSPPASEAPTPPPSEAAP